MDTQQQLSTICTFTSDVSLHLPKLYLYSNITSRTCRVDTATDTKIVRADNFLCRQRRNHTKYELAKWRRRHCVDTSQPQLAWRLIFMTHEARPAAATAATNYSCSTSAETCDRKCFRMQLILVVGKVDMINQICQMLFYWKILSAYFAEKMITKYLAKYSSSVHVLWIPTFVFFNVCMQIKLVNSLTYVQILSY